MFSIRKTKTASGATAIQVVRYKNRKTIICVHIGSSHEQENIALLLQQAKDWIANKTQQLALFPHSRDTQKETVLILQKTQYLGIRYSFIYDILSEQLHKFSFDTLSNQLLCDLVIMRIVQPASKLASLQLLEQMFGIVYQRGHIYEAIAEFASLQKSVEEKVITFAKQHYAFDFSLVFYDVTTLYVESFSEDTDSLDDEGNVVEKGLRRNGFSKDNKSNQPQIVIGLVVNIDGFPIAYEIFEGNTFEGDTFIPSLLKCKNTYGVKTLTVVADAAMISLDNVKKLQEEKLSYIVGARVANLSLPVMKQISTALGMVDGATGRIETDKGSLVYDFSLKRYQKDKREMEKQTARAARLVEKNTEGKRTKFLKRKDDEKDKQKRKKGDKANKEKVYELNTKLIAKTTLLLGIKGYYTNLSEEKADNKTIINQYHNLWHVEKAFRIAKHDIQMRPIYHYKRATIEAHILICFMAVAISKYMELTTGTSIKKIVRLFKGITDARIKNILTEEIITMRQELSEEVEKLWKTLTSS